MQFIGLAIMGYEPLFHALCTKFNMISIIMWDLLGMFLQLFHSRLLDMT